MKTQEIINGLLKSKDAIRDNAGFTAGLRRTNDEVLKLASIEALNHIDAAIDSLEIAIMKGEEK